MVITTVRRGTGPRANIDSAWTPGAEGETVSDARRAGVGRNRSGFDVQRPHQLAGTHRERQWPRVRARLCDHSALIRL
jgi:hypothetical protein